MHCSQATMAMNPHSNHASPSQCKPLVRRRPSGLDVPGEGEPVDHMEGVMCDVWSRCPSGEGVYCPIDTLSHEQLHTLSHECRRPGAIQCWPAGVSEDEVQAEVWSRGGNVHVLAPIDVCDEAVRGATPLVSATSTAKCRPRLLVHHLPRGCDLGLSVPFVANAHHALCIPPSDARCGRSDLPQARHAAPSGFQGRELGECAPRSVVSGGRLHQRPCAH